MQPHKTPPQGGVLLWGRCMSFYNFVWYNTIMDKNLKLIQLILSKIDGGVADLWKIYKIMYFVDFEHYSKHKKPISDLEYFNWPYGPMPYEDNQSYSMKNMIERGEALDMWRKIDSKNVQINSTPNVTKSFSDQELLTIENIISRYGNLSGKDLVSISHDDMPWKMTKLNEKIEYDYVFWRDLEAADSVEDITASVLN